MKPFVRFAREARGLYASDAPRPRRFFWDFDAMVQRVLLGVVQGTSTPEALANACTQRWAVNLAQLADGKRQELQRLAATGEQPRPSTHTRIDYVMDRMRPGSRFLYAGCGVGTECLAFARRGLNVIGIDTVPALVDVANAWAAHLALPFRAVCADAMALDAGLGSFDGFLVEFYGDQPSRRQALRLQTNLHGALTDGGRGFVVATRRKYASYWFRMGTAYSDLMTRRLAVQARFDYRFSQPDKSEEQLRYGLYTRTHTRESLAAELNRSFGIIECTYEDDPRYVTCVVGRKQVPPAEPVQTEDSDLAETWGPGLMMGAAAVDGLLDKVEAICQMLEEHGRNVQEFYDRPGAFAGKSPVNEIGVDYPRFLGLLEEVSAVLREGEGPWSWMP